MKFLSKIWNGFLNIFGLRKNSKYVKGYLNEANMRSAVFMSFVIFVLEVWLIIRQTQKYIIPTLTNPENTASAFQVIFQNTSNFILLISLGLAMFIYSLQYLNKKRTLTKMIVPIVSAVISFGVCCLLPLEFIYGSIKIKAGLGDAKSIYGVLKVLFYVAVALFDIGIIFSSIYRYKGGKRESVSSVLVISLFALVCLMFGVMVSYGDFISSKVFVDENGAKVLVNDAQQSFAYEHKEIICFLMFTIYIGCLLIWNPLISIGVLGTLFLGFYFALIHVADLGGRRLPDGDKVNYLTFFISLTMVCISIYNQRISEAKKDEELEALATIDKITGLLSFEYFVVLAREKMKEDNLGSGDGVYLFINIVGFKIYNDKKGFAEGNKFLKETGQIIKEVFTDSLVSRQSNDHFVVFTKLVSIENLEERIAKVNSLIEEKDPDIKLGIKVGGNITVESDEKPRFCVEKARYAYANLKQTKANKLLVLYDKEMHDNYLMIQYIVTHIDEAIENGYIKPYYQPVVWSKGRALCGVEALARWIDPKYGFLSPGKFIPALENARVVYKLDAEVLRLVCKDIRYNLDHGLPVIPVSINFSRADFGLVDIVEVVSKTVDEFKVPHELIHVEITESALADEEDVLKSTINRLHDIGFATWLDDFGSGYSSFNVLKDYEFDVLKLDMKFLTGFEGNDKAKSLIRSVISMADQIGMKTLCEGVETMEQAAFLEQSSCGRIQGYLYGKPLSYDELKQKIVAGEYTLSDDILVSKK